METISSDLTSRIINAAIEVHNALGPGMLESSYRNCLCHELKLRGFMVEQEKYLPITYKGLRLQNGYRIDIVVDDLIILELKTVEELNEVHSQQIVTYLKFGNYPLGLLINFRERLVKNGIRRFVNSLASR